MSPTKYIILISILLFSTPVKSQTIHAKYKIVYNLNYMLDSLSLETENIDTELLINDSISVFQPLKYRISDSILINNNPEKANRETLPSGIVLRPINKFKFKIIKKPTKIIAFHSLSGIDLNGKEIIYKYEEDLLKWRIYSDTLTIHNFLCQRAEAYFGGRQWIAWFTPEIPIFDGPYKFSGLPGLIIRISDSKNHWNFEMKSIKKEKYDYTYNFQKWYVIKEKKKVDLFQDREKLNDFIRMVILSPGDGDERYPDKKYDSNEVLNNFNKDLASQNNWIELYP